MKKTLMALMVGFMFVGSVGCSTAPKQTEEASPVVAAEETTLETPVEQAPAEMSNSDLSLGAGSSGRGH